LKDFLSKINQVSLPLTIQKRGDSSKQVPAINLAY
jgi:hypothetical protein